MAENSTSANSSSEDDTSVGTGSNEIPVDDDIDLNGSRQDAVMIFSRHVVKRIQAKKRMSEQQVMALTTPEALEEVELFFAGLLTYLFALIITTKSSLSAHV
jgi:hypothetical protein